ncbi:hypothetical protein SRA_03246 [Streptococcus ratti FA-1 = DSM 20564]|uniref:Uncharacterized protein n=1 Tax=Streptococcus ratti FA-1 = DSM 20564 TaxID=699248 RepID=A0ABP2R0K8_STRRT|nr:hypothetical protein SRA_03246 [Streptococcus ratti FA-1 = DSM 20564]
MPIRMIGELVSIMLLIGGFTFLRSGQTSRW